jgi:hypothetical protein
MWTPCYSLFLLRHSDYPSAGISEAEGKRGIAREESEGICNEGKSVHIGKSGREKGIGGNLRASEFIPFSLHTNSTTSLISLISP